MRPRFSLVHRNRKTPVKEHPITLGDYLRKVRTERSLTLKQTALMLNVSLAVVSLWERNCFEPRDELRARVIRFLGFDPTNRT